MTARDDLIFHARSIELPGGIPAVDGHLHTTWTDGRQSVAEAHEAALSEGLRAMLFSEHSRKTSIDWFSQFAEEVRQLPRDTCRAWVGTEVKVETQGGDIDTCDEISTLCDLIVVSVHRFPSVSGDPIAFSDVTPAEAENRELQLSLAALDNDRTAILGHPMGMTISRFSTEPSEESYRKILEKASQCGVAFEINAAYHSSPTTLLKMAREYDALVSFGSDAHDSANVGLIGRRLRGLHV